MDLEKTFFYQDGEKFSVENKNLVFMGDITISKQQDSIGRVTISNKIKNHWNSELMGKNKLRHT